MVDSGIAREKEAAFYTTVLWIVFTVARFLQGFLNMKVSTSLKRFSLLGAASTALCVLFSFLDWHEVAVWICIVTQGISVSGIFLYNLSLPS